MASEAILKTLFHSGLGVDIALGFIALEFAFILWRSPSATRKMTIMNLILALGPGAFLMLALRCALTGASLIWIAFWLALSLPLHLIDIARRRL